MEILKENKTNTSIKYTGCSLEELKKHLENKFQHGMNWDNYGCHTFGNDKTG